MPNQYTKLTRENILTKVNRKKNPVSSLAQLAREFGYSTEYNRTYDYWGGRSGRKDHAAPATFRRKVRALVGEKVYNQIRNANSVNLIYR